MPSTLAPSSCQHPLWLLLRPVTQHGPEQHRRKSYASAPSLSSSLSSPGCWWLLRVWEGHWGAEDMWGPCSDGASCGECSVTVPPPQMWVSTTEKQPTVAARTWSNPYLLLWDAHPSSSSSGPHPSDSLTLAHSPTLLLFPTAQEPYKRLKIAETTVIAYKLHTHPILTCGCVHMWVPLFLMTRSATGNR